MKKFKQYIDWLVLFVLAIAALIVFIVIQTLNDPKVTNRPTHSDRTNTYTSDATLEPINPEFPAPGGTEREFYKTYSVGDIQYSLEILVTNPERHPVLDKPKFRIIFTNTTNKELFLTPAPEVTFGCAATADPYQKVSINAESLSIPPLSSITKEMSVDQKCVYIGTADQKYYWRLY